MLSKLDYAILLSVAGLAACSPGQSDTQNLALIQQDKTITTLNCDDFAKVQTPLGDLQNNVWNAHSAGDYKWTQCMASRVVNNQTQYGWYWQWPGNGTQVYAQPQITLGNSPWLDHVDSKPNYPIPIQTLESLDIDYAVELESDGALNLASTLWLTTSPTIQAKVDKSTIAVEMMIWTYATKGFYPDPAGEKVGELSSNGIHWEVWLNKNWHDTSGMHNNNWTYLAFRALEPTLTANIDVAELLRYSIEQQLIPQNLYIADIQLGNEVMSGTGQAWLKYYRVNINNKAAK